MWVGDRKQGINKCWPMDTAVMFLYVIATNKLFYLDYFIP